MRSANFDAKYRRIEVIMIIIWIVLSFVSLGCSQPTARMTTVNTVTMIWKGSSNIAPRNPSIGWAYYDTSQKKSFIWNGQSWEILSQDGKSIVWKGELATVPSNPQENWTYYNVIDGNSYIYNGYTWDFLAKSGRDGSTGILLWLGTLSTAPNTPQTGWAYYNSTEKASYLWDGDSWEILARDGINGEDGVSIIWKGSFSNHPSNPSLNWAYYNTSDKSCYIWDGKTWQIFATNGNTSVVVPISWKGNLNSAPLNPQIGWMYYNTVLGKSYIWDGSVWNIVAQDGQTANSSTGFLMTWQGCLSSPPSNPQKGWAYYDTSQKKSYLWDGASWQVFAQDGINGAPGGSGANQSYFYFSLYLNEVNYSQLHTSSFSSVDFGTAGLGTIIRTTLIQIGLIGGNGDSTLNLTGNPPIQISGINADCFTVVQPSTTTTTTGKYIMDASIAFVPNSTGIKTAIVTIPNDSPDKPSFSFTVTGEGSLWPKNYDGGEGDGNDRITCSIYDNQGNLYFIGYGFELVNHHSGYDWWIKKFDSSGDEINTGWNKKIDHVADYAYLAEKDVPIHTLVDTVNNLVVASKYNTHKFAPDGTELWKKNYGGTLYLDSQNNVFIVNASSIKKHSSTGTVLWEKNYGGKLALSTADDIIVYSEGSIKFIAADGTEKWNQTVSPNVINSAAFDSSHNVYIAGYGSNLVDQYSKKDVFIKKYDTMGIEVTSNWSKVFDWGHSDDESAERIFFDGSNIIVSGCGNDLINGASAEDGWIKKFTTSGSLLSSFIIQEAKTSLLTIDESRYFYFTAGYPYNMILCKYDSSGNLITIFNKEKAISYPVFMVYSDGSIYIAGSESNLVTSTSNEDWIIRKN